MIIDYAELAVTAKTLVEGTGRPVTFVQLDTTAADPARPHRGAATPRGAGATEVEGDAVAVPPSSATQLGISTLDEDFLKRAEQILIAIPDAGSPELDNFDEVIDGSVRWKINAIQKLRPADVTLLYFMSVRR